MFRIPGQPTAIVLMTLLAAAIVGLAPVSTQESAARRRTLVGGREAVDGEVLVKYRHDRVSIRDAEIAARVDADAVETLSPRGVRRLHSRRLGTAALIATLQADPDVEYVEPNYILYQSTAPNDPSFTGLWALLNTGTNTVGGGGLAGADIDATTAWATTTGSRSFVVGVLDSGVDYNHVDLAANMWTAPSQFQVTIAGQTITCAAGTHGFNAITRTCTPLDDNAHGTHVAGTIGATGNNGLGVVGVNWLANMMALKFLGANGSGSTSDAIAAIEFAIQAKTAFAQSGAANVRVLSNSWGGGGYSAALVDAIEAANDAEMLFVAAAGNNHTNNDVSPAYPASYTVPNVISVASSDSADRLSSFSNYGATSVHLAAPGTAILSTVPNNAYSVFNGTSMATPQVSGVAMLALAACTLTTTELKNLLLDNVDPVAAFAGVTRTGGRLNAARTLQSCQYPRATSLSLTADRPSPQPPNTVVTWTATPSGGQAPHQYQWALFDGVVWSTVKEWSAENTFAWTPPTASVKYQVAARVRSAWNSGAREVATVQPFTIMPLVTTLSLTPSLPAPQGVGATITWTAVAAGGQPPYQYQFAQFDGTAWTNLTNWTTSATYAWTPPWANNNYQVAVRARGSWNAGNREMVTMEAFAVKAKVTTLTMTPNRASPQAPNTAITWTATAGGGQAPYQYQWAVFDGSSWTTVADWATGNTFQWTPTAAGGAYQVAVRARSAWNSGARETAVTQPYAVQPMVSGLTLTPSVASPQAIGGSVTWTAVASGGQAPYQYQWAVSDGVTWTTIRDWSSAAAFTWTPTSANAGYQFAVRARSAWNTGTREMATTQAFAVMPRITSLTLSPHVAAPRAANTTVTWTAVASGGQGPYSYQWAVYDGAVWTTVVDWTTSNTFAWTPASANSGYQIAVRARGTWNAGPREMATVQAFAITP